MRHIKRLVCLCFSLVMFIGLFSVAASAANVVSYKVIGGNIYFDPTTGTITACDQDVVQATIPAEIGGYAVTAIGDCAFSRCENLYFIEMPDSIHTIGICAFEDCFNLQDFPLPASLTTICWGAFLGCESLTAVNIPEGVTVIDIAAYSGCIALETVTFPSTLQKIEKEAFSDCWKLKNVLIPKKVSHIGRLAFDDRLMEKLQFDPNNPYFCWDNGILFSENKKTLHYFPSDRTGSYTVPYGVTSISDGAFSSSELFQIILPDTVETIGEYAFSGCMALTNIHLPSDLREIGKAAFFSCSNLQTVTFGKKLETIGEYAFARCKALTELSLPNSLQVIDKHAFEACWSLKTIDMPYSMIDIGEYAFHECTSLTEIIIPQDIQVIRPRTFYMCRSLTQVTIPLSVTNIEYLAFRECRELTDIFYEGSEQQWKKVKVLGNDYSSYDNLFYDKKHYNATMPIPPTGTSYASTQTVTIDGKAIELQAYALKDKNGYDTNYVKLRDIALLLNGTNAQFNVGWDGAVNIITNTAYTANGSEMNTPFDGNRSYELAFAKTKINGVEIDVTAILLKDDQGGGYTYYKLRDLGQALGFDVSWVQGTGITIDSNLPYTAD